MAFQSFEELDVWKRSCGLAVSVYELTKDWRDYGMKDQMQRCAVSIPSNIAEGHERRGKDFARFLRIAKGSAAELRTQIYISKKVGLIAPEQFSNLLDEAKQISKMLAGLHKAVEAQNF